MREHPTGLGLHARQFDYFLAMFVLFATGFGILVLAGSTRDVPELAKILPQQARWWGIAIGVFCLTLAVPYRWLKIPGWIVYGMLVVSLAALVFASHLGMAWISTVRAGGASSWYKIALGSSSIRFQPSEFAKIGVVIVLAHWLSLRRESIAEARGWRKPILECIVPLAVAALPMAIVFLQPDFGTASVFLPLPFIVLFVAGLPWRVVLTTVAFGTALALGGFVYLMNADHVPGLKPYQLNRIRVFLEPLGKPFNPPGVEEILYGPAQPEVAETSAKSRDPDDWQIRQAEMALGSGRLFGKGWGQGTQSRLRFLPAHHTDFIFSSLGEQFGLAGCLALLLLYVLIVWRCVHVALVASDAFGQYLVVGLLSIFILHVFLNIGMSVRLLPTTGLPLPLFSFGGSFLVTNYVIFGLIANVGMRREPKER
ncbi:rod shape-determining protein RodA [Candidatus Sumerlaeota bacterium]|nr:rod shape-determining protein RodA [Candidatus Sumerlaeota bacterium]